MFSITRTQLLFCTESDKSTSSCFYIEPVEASSSTFCPRKSLLSISLVPKFIISIVFPPNFHHINYLELTNTANIFRKLATHSIHLKLKDRGKQGILCSPAIPHSIKQPLSSPFINSHNIHSLKRAPGRFLSIIFVSLSPLLTIYPVQ